LAKDFHRIHAENATVLLLEAGPRILTAFPEALSSYAVAKLEKLGVTVRTNCAVERIASDHIVAGGQEIGTGFAIWAAGVRASPLGAMLGVPTDRAGRIAVGPGLAVPGLDCVYALGDIALAEGTDGKPLPGL